MPSPTAPSIASTPPDWTRQVRAEVELHTGRDPDPVPCLRLVGGNDNPSTYSPAATSRDVQRIAEKVRARLQQAEPGAKP